MGHLYIWWPIGICLYVMSPTEETSGHQILTLLARHVFLENKAVLCHIRAGGWRRWGHHAVGGLKAGTLHAGEACTWVGIKWKDSDFKCSITPLSTPGKYWLLNFEFGGHFISSNYMVKGPVQTKHIWCREL